MADFDVPLKRLRFGETMRPDAWWLFPALTFLGLAAFVAYATWAAFQGAHYTHGNYLSPFYSPEIFGDSPHALFGRMPGWLPDWMPRSPALLILWAPAGFRLTCYYYRGAYYKAFWADPPACAVGEPRTTYLGERSFPLILQNVHRYFFYLALVFIVFLSKDAWQAMWFTGSDGREHFGIGVGSLVLAANATLLAGYTLGCHSFRHLVGGGRDRFSDSKARRTCYGGVSALNRRHMLWAWCSLFCVAFADVYVRLCSMGVIQDGRIL